MTVFDHIIAGNLPASQVHEDELCVAFLDIRPLSRGHTLVVPRKSVAELKDLNKKTRAHLWEVGHRIAAAQQAGLGSVAQHFLLNDGKGASQSVPHVHLHVIPRYEGDGIGTVARMIWHIAMLPFPPREKASDRVQFDRDAADIAAQMK